MKRDLRSTACNSRMHYSLSGLFGAISGSKLPCYAFFPSFHCMYVTCITKQTYADFLLPTKCLQVLPRNTAQQKTIQIISVCIVYRICRWNKNIYCFWQLKTQPFSCGQRSDDRENSKRPAPPPLGTQGISDRIWQESHKQNNWSPADMYVENPSVFDVIIIMSVVFFVPIVVITFSFRFSIISI